MNAAHPHEGKGAPAPRRKRAALCCALLLALLSGLGAEDNPGEEAYTDQPFWRQAIGGQAIGRPVAQAESVVIAADGGNIASYSWQGKPLWNYFARGRLTPHISRSREGTTYLCRTNGLFIAVNRTGRELWQINLHSPITAPALTGWDGRLFVITDRKLTCLTGAGYTLWSRNLEKKPALAPVRDIAGGVIIVLEEGELLRFDPFGNVFSHPLGAVPAALASLDIPGWGHTILLAYGDRHLELVYPALGYGETLKGKLELPAAPLALAGRKGEAAALLADGRAALVSLEQRKILWTAQGHLRSGELPARSGPDALELFYDERGVYVITRTGAAGFAADGRRLWIIRLKGAAALPSFSDDGVLYAGGSDWILYAYRLETRIRAKQRVLYGEAPEGSYGTGSPGPSSWADYPYRFDEKELETRLREIRQAVKNGSIGANEKEYAAWLQEAAGSLVENPRSGNHPPVQARYRAEAARLLAYIGSRETIPFLADLFTREKEALVKAAAAEAIGKIGVDPEGFALKAFGDALFPPAPLRDEAALTAVAAAAGSLCRFSGPPLSAEGIRILTALSANELLPIRAAAQRELSRLTQ